MKHQYFFYFLLIVLVVGCGGESDSPIHKVDAKASSRIELTDSELETAMINELNRILTLRINGSYEKLSSQFHDLEWESAFDAFPELAHEEFPGRFLERKFRSVGKQYDWSDSYFIEDVTGKYIDNELVVFVVNYRIETRGSLDLIINQNQILMESIDGGISWKYFRIVSEDCFLVYDLIKKHYNEIVFQKLNDGLCRTNSPKSDRGEFHPVGIEQIELKAAIEQYVQDFFLGTPMKALNYLPDEFFEYMNNEMGGGHSIDELKSMFSDEFINEFQSDLKTKNVSLKLHKILSKVEVSDYSLYAMSYSTVITDKYDSSNISEMGGELICVFNKKTNTWKFIENDQDQTSLILKKMFPNWVVDELLDYKYEL